MNKLVQALHEQMELVGYVIGEYIFSTLELFSATVLASALPASVLSLVDDVSEATLVNLGGTVDAFYASIAPLFDIAGLLFDGMVESLDIVVSVASAFTFRVQALPRRALRKPYYGAKKLTPLQVAFLIFVLDLLLRYPVTKLWDYIWGKLFP
jgi:hypothetical protein